MLVVLSPAKKQDFETPAPISKHTLIACKKETSQLIEVMQKLSAAKIASLMSLSANLAKLNYQRYQDYNKTYYTAENSKAAIYAFQGDVYQGLQADTFDSNDIDFAQNHLAILSGLYGVLRPLDYIQPHRLEMGTALANPKGNTLYAFWHDTLLDVLDTLLAESGSRVLINLASGEYFKAVDTSQLNATVITVDFKEYKDGKFSTIGLFAKRARGMMANFIVKERITIPEHLKQFNTADYKFNKELSSKDKFVFTRKK